MTLLRRIKSLVGRSSEPVDRSSGGGITIEQVSAADSPGVQTVDGIGPAYEERLAEAGIETVDDLAAADPETLAAETEIERGRIENWRESIE